MQDDYSRMAVGFVFEKGFKHVLLIEKQSPDWQRGLLNGIGGKCKQDEPFILTIARETFEETDLLLVPELWTHFLTLHTGFKPGTADKVEVQFFFSIVERCIITSAQKKTKEHVLIIPCRSLQNYKTLPNLQWMIPLAMNWSESVLPYQYAKPLEVFEEPKATLNLD